MNEVKLQETFKILSFDPGLGTTGYSVSEYNIVTGLMKVLKFGSINAVKLASVVANRELVNQYGKRLITLQILTEHIKKLVKSIKPDFVVAEDAFCNPTRVNAYEALLQWHTVVGNLLYNLFGLPLYKMSPKHIKLIAAGDGRADKINIQKAITTNPRIEFKSNIINITLNEHESDSIAVGFAFTRSILAGILGTEYFDKYSLTSVVTSSKTKKRRKKKII